MTVIHIIENGRAIGLDRLEAEARGLVPPLDVPGVPVKRYSKSRLFMAMTDAEFATFAGIQAAQPEREQAIFANAVEVAEDHPMFAKFYALLIEAYGPERTANLLTAARL